MGREIRPVALDWEHPQSGGTYADGSPRYVPLYSRESLLFHLNDRAAHPEDYEGEDPPDPADYMPELREGTPFGWQLYETVSEGTPLSPVCKTKDELAAWMSSPEAGRDRVSPEVAARFVEAGWAPSFVMSAETGLISGVEAIGRERNG